MHPAYSVIFFTTSSGAGYGLLFLLSLQGALGHTPSSSLYAALSIMIALVLVTFGLLSSTFHLGHPERAWRALSQWKTSWLSREGVLAVATYPFALLFGLKWSGLVQVPLPVAFWGGTTALLAMLTVFSTGQIYATLKTIRAWHTPLTTPVYLAFGLASGATLLNAIDVTFGVGHSNNAALSGGAILFLMVLKILYWKMIDHAPRDRSMSDATGLKPHVRQWEVPHTQKNYVQREMGFIVARRHSDRLRKLGMMLLFIAGLANIAIAIVPTLAYIGFIAIAAGAFFERWLFFAEAEHVVTLFYGNERA